MMNMKKIIVTMISAATVLMSSIGIGANAKETIDQTSAFKHCGVYDDYGFYDSQELSELNELVQDTAKEIDMYVAIYLSGANLTDPQTEEFADEYYESKFGQNTDGLVYYMDLSGGVPAYDYISTSGRAALIYTDERNDGSDNRISKMLSNIFEYLPSSGEMIEKEDITRGIEEICSQLEYYASQGVKSGYFCYDSIDNKYIYEKGGKVVVTSTKPISMMFRYLFPGIIAGIIIGVISFFVIKFKYRFKTACDSSVYVEKDKTNFHVKSDRFIREYTTKTKIESSSGGGRSGGRSGGGGSHGGGGGHR